MAVAGVLFAGALVALALRREEAFWVLFGLTIVWQVVALEVRPSRRRRVPAPRRARLERRTDAE
jgi:hypothetical protein